MSGEKRRACDILDSKVPYEKEDSGTALFLHPSKFIPFPLRAHLTTSPNGGPMVDDRHLVTLLRRSSRPQSPLERTEPASYPYLSSHPRRDTLPQWNVPEEQFPFAIEHLHTTELLAQSRCDGATLPSNNMSIFPLSQRRHLSERHNTLYPREAVV
ncbi:hypothetical protein ARMGADRAFT_750601 [Armillaria gallica]|uniref:Uncharacterized protein n=1 Tax=Armillaria gallica TaxID=47427 RepID=A0A2H3DWM7_ARMGA|nr:hypothetical protein ARMGADRAFT_750601 [Armillaria gallica]